MYLTNFFACRHDNGAVLPGASATVYLTGTTTHASIFNATGGAIGNPMTADTTGRVIFKAADGVYDIAIVSADGNYTAPPIQQYNVADVAVLSAQVNALSAVALTNQGLVFDTLAHMNADLAHAANTLAVVYADGTPANNGFYAKVGASGVGSWNNTGLALPSTFAADVAAAVVAAASAIATAGAANTTANAALAAAAADLVTTYRVKSDLLFLNGLPPGYSGVWFADQALLPASAELRTVIPNMATAVAPSANLLGAPKRLFGNNTYWVPGGTVAVTDTNAVDWRGLANQASTIVLSGGAFLRPAGFQGGGTDTVPVGRYSAVVIARRGTGSNQSWRMTEFSTSTHSGTFTATSTDQAFVWTFDWAGGSMHLLELDTIDEATAATLIVSLAGFWATPGRALGVTTTATTSTGIAGVTDPLGGHMYLGYANTDPKPVISGGAFDQSGGGFGLIQFDQDQVLSAFTVVAITLKTAENNGFGGVLSKVQQYTDFTVSTEFNEGIYTQAIYGLHQHLFSPATDLNRWQAYHEVFDGATDAVGINGVPLESYALAGSRTVADLWSGIVSGTSIGSKNKIAALLVWPRALSPSELRYAITQVKARLSASGITLPARKLFIAEGHSMMAGALLSPASSGFGFQQGLHASPQINGVNFAESGDAMAHIKGRLAKVRAIVQAAVAEGQPITVHVMIGRNDFSSGTTASAFTTDLSANYLGLIKGDGADVTVYTVPTATAPGYNTWRHAVNTTIRSWAGGAYATRVLDLDTITGIGGDSDAGTPDSAANATATTAAFGNYLDGTHWSQAGNDRVRPYATTAVNAAPG